MFKRLFTFSLSAILLMTVISLTPASAPASVQAAPMLTVPGENWEVQGGSSSLGIRSGDIVKLNNLTTNLCLSYKVRDYGINLGWDSGCYPNIKFVKNTASPIRYGDPVAIWVSGGGYLHYQVREYGINLVWSSEPVFEWEVRGGDPGRRVRSNKHIALYNYLEGDYVVYCPRPYGINLRWLADC